MPNFGAEGAHLLGLVHMPFLTLLVQHFLVVRCDLFVVQLPHLVMAEQNLLFWTFASTATSLTKYSADITTNLQYKNQSVTKQNATIANIITTTYATTILLTELIYNLI